MHSIVYNENTFNIKSAQYNRRLARSSPRLKNGTSTSLYSSIWNRMDDDYFSTEDCDAISTSSILSDPDYNTRKKVHTQRKSSINHDRHQVHKYSDRQSLLECKVCLKEFNRTPAMCKHDKQRKGPCRYRCKTCGKKYMSRNSMKKHERTHTGEKYECEFCDKIFMSISGKYSHQKRHIVTNTGGPTNPVLKVTTNKVNNIKEFRCGKCETDFVNKYTLRSHNSKCRLNGPPKMYQKGKIVLTKSPSVEDVTSRFNFDSFPKIRVSRATYNTIKTAGSDIGKIELTKLDGSEIDITQNIVKVETNPLILEEPYANTTIVTSDVKDEIPMDISDTFSSIQEIPFEAPMDIGNEIPIKISSVCSMKDVYGLIEKTATIEKSSVTEILTEYKYSEQLPTTSVPELLSSAKPENKLIIPKRIKSTSKTCYACGKRIQGMSRFSQHIRKHSPRKKFECDIRFCSEIFTDRTNLKRRLKSIHKCNICRKKYRHLRTDGVRHSCQLCQTKLYRDTTRKIYELRNRIKKKSFNCGFCYKTFDLKSDLVCHENVHISTQKFLLNGLNFKHCEEFLIPLEEKIHEPTLIVYYVRVPHNFRNYFKKAEFSHEFI